MTLNATTRPGRPGSCHPLDAQMNAATIAAADGPTVEAMLEQLREGAGAPSAELLARERERADAWQAGGFDTDLIKAKRESLK